MTPSHEQLHALARRIASGTMSRDEALRAVVDAITASVVGDVDDAERWSAARRQVLTVVRGDRELLELVSATRWRAPMPAAPSPPPAPAEPDAPDEPLFEGASQSRVARVAVGSFPVVVVGMIVVGVIAWGAAIFSGDDPPPSPTATTAVATEAQSKATDARAPAVVAGALAPTSASIDEAFVWYTTAQPPLVGRVRSIGGEPTTIASEPDPGSIVQTAEHVLWLSRTPTGSLMRALHKRDVTAPPTTVEVAPMRPIAATLWEVEAAFVDETDGAIATVSLAGGPPTKLTGPLQPRPIALAADAAGIAWSSAGAGATVGVVARGGGAPIVLATEQTDPRGLALDESHAWWVDGATGSLRRAPRAGGAVETVLAGGVERFALDASSIYWSDAAAGEISSRAKAGGEITVIASAQKAPSWVLVDAAAVYWITAGRLLRLPK